MNPPLKPVPLAPRYALADEPCPPGWLETPDPVSGARMLIPMEAFHGALTWMGAGTPGDAPAHEVTVLDTARLLISKNPEVRELTIEDFDLEQPDHIAAAIVLDADPPGRIVIGRQAAEAEAVPYGYAEARATSGERLFILIGAFQPFTMAKVASGELPPATVSFGDGPDPDIEHEGRLYRSLNGTARPTMHPEPLSQPSLIEMGAPALGQPAAPGFYPEAHQECPAGYVEVTDSEGKRAFLDAGMVAAVRAGQEFTGAGPSMRQQLGDALMVEAASDTAAMLEMIGIPTVNRSPKAVAARAAAEAQSAKTAAVTASAPVPGVVSVPADIFIDLAARFTETSRKASRFEAEFAKVRAAYNNAGDNRLWDAVRDMIANVGADVEHGDDTGDVVSELAEAVMTAREERDAAITALSYVTAGDPVPPDAFYKDPRIMDLMSSLKRARAQRELMETATNTAYSERNAALAAVAWLGIWSGLVRAGVAENDDGRVDPENPGWDLLYLDVPTMRPGPPKPERIGFHVGPRDKDVLTGLPRDPAIVPDDWSKEEDRAIMAAFLAWLAYKPSGPVLFVDPSSTDQ